MIGMVVWRLGLGGFFCYLFRVGTGDRVVSRFNVLRFFGF